MASGDGGDRCLVELFLQCVLKNFLDLPLKGIMPNESRRRDEDSVKNG